MSNDYAIETEGLRKSFGDVEALCGVDLAVEAGTVLGLLGPNGAGKTTAVRASDPRSERFGTPWGGKPFTHWVGWAAASSRRSS